MRKMSIALAVVVFAATVATTSVGAQMIKIGHGDGDSADVVMLRELGIVAGAGENAGDLRVIVLLPGTDREVSIERDDLLLMIDGKRVRDAAALREAYEAAGVGDVVKIGFRRGDERFLASFEKQDPEEGAVRMMILGGPDSDFDDLQPLHEFGVVLGESDGEVVVAVRMPTDDASLEDNDVLKSINGKSIETLSDFREVYEALDEGQDVVLVVRRGDEEFGSTRAKSAAHGMMQIRRGH